MNADDNNLLGGRRRTSHGARNRLPEMLRSYSATWERGIFVSYVFPLSRCHSPPEAAVMRHDNPDTQMVFIQNDRFCDKFAKLNLSAKLSASFLAGMVAVKESGVYLDRERTSSSVIEQSLRYRLQTKYQRFYWVTYPYIYSSISPRP